MRILRGTRGSYVGGRDESGLTVVAVCDDEARCRAFFQDVVHRVVQEAGVTGLTVAIVPGAEAVAAVARLITRVQLKLP